VILANNLEEEKEGGGGEERVKRIEELAAQL